jgi:hypothetical protein
MHEMPPSIARNARAFLSLLAKEAPLFATDVQRLLSEGTPPLDACSRAQESRIQFS